MEGGENQHATRQRVSMSERGRETGKTKIRKKAERGVMRNDGGRRKRRGFSRQEEGEREGGRVRGGKLGKKVSGSISLEEGGRREGEKRKCLKMRLSHWFKMPSSKGNWKRSWILQSSNTQTPQTVSANTVHISARRMKAINHSTVYPEEYNYALKILSHI